MWLNIFVISRKGIVSLENWETFFWKTIEKSQSMLWISGRQSASVVCVLVKNYMSLSMRCKSDAISTICLLKDLMFSKINTKVLVNMVNISCWMNRPHFVEQTSYSWVASIFALMEFHWKVPVKYNHCKLFILLEATCICPGWNVFLFT